MTVQELTLTNYRLHRRLTLQPRRVTVLFGGHGTGKQTVLEALRLAKASRGVGVPCWFDDLLLARRAQAPEGVYRRSDPPGTDALTVTVNGTCWLAYGGDTRGGAGSNQRESVPPQVADWCFPTPVPLELDDGTLGLVERWLEDVFGYRPQQRCPAPGAGWHHAYRVLTHLLATPPGGLFGMEDVSHGLAPAAAGKLADVLIAAPVKRQMLVTTYSEHFLMALLHNVAEGRLPLDDLALYHFRREPRDYAEPEVRLLEVTERGLVKGGLPDFLDAAMDSLQRGLAAHEQRHLREMSAR